MDTSRTGAQNAKLSTLEHIILSTDGMANSAATGEAIKQLKPRVHRDLNAGRQPG